MSRSGQPKFAKGREDKNKCPRCGGSSQYGKCASRVCRESVNPFDEEDYTSNFKKAAIPYIKGAIEIGRIKEHRGSEVLLAWVAGFASSKLSTIFLPWTQEHTRRVFDLARLVMTTESTTS